VEHGGDAQEREGIERFCLSRFSVFAQVATNRARILGFCLISIAIAATIVEMPDVVQSVRQLLQDFIAPELRELKSDVKSLESKLSSDVKSLESKLDADVKLLASENQSTTKRLEAKLDAGFSELRSLIENRSLRAELESTRDIADLRERVTRLETERGIQRQ